MDLWKKKKKINWENEKDEATVLGARCCLVSSHWRAPPQNHGWLVVVVVGFRGRSGEACQVHFGNEPVSERAHMVHAVGSVVNLLQEVFQLLDENALFEPWKEWNKQTSRFDFSTLSAAWFLAKKKMGRERASSKCTKLNSGTNKAETTCFPSKAAAVYLCWWPQAAAAPRHERMIQAPTWLLLWLCFGGRWVACPTFPGSASGGGKSSRNLKQKGKKARKKDESVLPLFCITYEETVD